jgi:hypothetical protein
LGRSLLPAARPVAPFLLVAALALVVAGCDLMVAPASARPSRASRTPEPVIAPSEGTDEVPTLRPDSSGTGPDLVDAANALADLDSYRVAVVSTGLVPASTADGRVTMTSTLVQGDAPAAKFTMVGVDGLDGGRLDAVVIGDEAWLRPGGGRWHKSPGGAADFDAAFTALSPIDLASAFESLTGELVALGRETRNGIPTDHYRADSQSPTTVAAGLSEGSADLWLAVAGGYLVGLDVAGTWDVDETPTPVTLKIDVTHVNDRANAITPPA